MWLRWRILMRSLMRGRGRDIVERFSVAAESLAPVVVALMLIPGALGLAAVAFLAGYWIAQPAGELLLQVIQYTILFIGGFAVLAPLVFPASTQASGQVRLLLLPIPRGLLYATQALGALADPWIVLIVPMLAMLPIGLLFAGRPWAAGTAMVGGVLVLAIVVAVAVVSASLLQLLLRNRRRGESALVVAMIVLPFIFMLPSLLITDDEWREAREPRSGGRRSSNARFERTLKAGTRYLPPALYGSAVRGAAGVGGGPRVAGGPTAAIGALALLAAALHAAGWRLYRRVLETPATGGGRRLRDPSRPPPAPAGLLRGVPGLSDAARAVAWAFVRLVFRTPRGKTVVFTIAVIMPIFGVMMMRAGGLPFAFTTLRPGFSMAIFGLALTLLSLAPMSLNQFAVDRAGLTLEFLSPISDRDLLVGKAAGGAIVLAGPAIFVLAVSIAMSLAGPAALWLALAFGAAATYALVAPANAALSAIFPRAANLASVGRDSNAHQGANLLGLLALAAAAAPSALAAAAGLLVFHSAALAALLVGLWCGAAVLLSSLLFRAIEPLIAARRENLAFVAQGR
jgi:hypothetical protein